MHELKFHTSLRNIVVCLIIKVYFLIFKVLTVENGRRHKDIVKIVVTLTGVWSLELYMVEQHLFVVEIYFSVVLYIY